MISSTYVWSTRSLFGGAALLFGVLFGGCVTSEEALISAQRFAARVPGATGVECDNDGPNEYHYCNIFMEDGPPISVRCDQTLCTGLPAPARPPRTTHR